MHLGVHALRSAIAWSGGAALAALLAGGVRVLPWCFDPAIPWSVAAPFARSLITLALEAALLVGWPIGFSLAMIRLVERGEARVLALLGERPERTLLGFFPQTALLAAILASISYVGGRDASQPGRMMNALVEQARSSCLAAPKPTSFAVPFASLSWLCAPPSPPRLFGKGPNVLSAIAFTASSLETSGDLRKITLSDARLVFGAANVHVGGLVVRGLPPWTHASSLPPLARAFLMALSAASCALLAAYLSLARISRRRFFGFIVGASGPMATLGLLRALERNDASWIYFFLLPLAGAAATVASAFLLSNLPRAFAIAKAED